MMMVIAVRENKSVRRREGVRGRCVLVYVGGRGLWWRRQVQAREGRRTDGRMEERCRDEV